MLLIGTRTVGFTSWAFLWPPSTVVLLELADKVETVAALATVILDIGSRTLDFDGAALETSEVGAALLGLFCVEQSTTDRGIGGGLGHVSRGAWIG